MNRTYITRILLVILLALPSVAYAQRFEVKKNHTYEMSEPYDKVDGKQYYHTIEDGLIAIKIHGIKITVQKFDSETLKETSKKVYEDMGRGMKYESIVSTNAGSYLFYAVYDKKQKKEFLGARQIFDDGTLGKKKNLLTSLRRVESSNRIIFGFNANPIGLGIKYKIQLSNDSSQLFIKYRTKSDSKKNSKNTEVIGLFAFDSNLEKISGKEYKMPYKESELKLKGYCMDKENNIYIYSHIKGGDKKSWVPKILRIENESEIIDEYDLEHSISKIFHFTLYQDTEGHGTFATFVRENGSKGINSIYKVVFDLNGEITSEITSNFMSSLSKDQARSKNHLSNFVFNKVLLNQDGSILFVAQLYDMTVIYDGNGTSSKTTHYYKDIVLIKMSKDGEIEWGRLLPKNQMTTKGIRHLTYKHFENDGKHYLVFLDNVKNMDPSTSKVYKHYLGKKGFITAYEVDNNTGEANKMSILDITKTKNSTTDEIYNLGGVKANQFIGLQEGGFVFEVTFPDNKNVLIKCEVLE